MSLEANVPSGPIEEKWARHKNELMLVAPANRRKHTLIVVGTGLAGASAAASLGQMGYNVLVFCIQDSARRAHAIAAQGGINAAKNYQNDGDSVYRLFRDTIKGGDFRSREANVYRMAELSLNVIDQCVAQGVPFAREYGGLLTNRSFGGAQVSRTFYARGQTGQQLLLAAYGALVKEVYEGAVKMFPRHEMLDLVVIDGKARGVVTRNLITGELESYVGDAVIIATGGYGNAFFLSTNAKSSNGTAIWRACRRGAYFANPCFTQVHPTCIPVHGLYQSKLTLMSESLRNDGRVWVPENPDDKRSPNDIPDEERDYYLERMYPAFGNLVPRDLACRRAKDMIDAGKGVGPWGSAVYLDLREAIARLGEGTIDARYSNLLEMYHKITDVDAHKEPMVICPAVHYTMGGLWVDYNLMSNLPGLFVIGEGNFSDHGANRLGASGLMQGLADGYFIMPYTVAHYLASNNLGKVDTDAPEFKVVEAEVKARVDKLVAVKGKRVVDDFHRELGVLLWNQCGISRNAQGLEDALKKIAAIREEFWENVTIAGSAESLNQSLERAGRVADYLEFAEMMVHDALDREESCGCHFREEHQTAEGEALRDDENFCYVGAWEYTGVGEKPILHKEPLVFEEVELSRRSYT